MNTFEFIRPADAAAAIAAAAQAKTAQQGADVRFIAGGTTLVDLMKLNVETPGAAASTSTACRSTRSKRLPDGGLKIGATVRNSDLAHHATVQTRLCRALAGAFSSGASAQLRNMATTAGNLLQRTRCVYFRDTAMPCNKREPGTGCPAITGSNRMLAILGTSEHCIATNPSDMCVAMAALEATIHVQGPKGSRAIPFGDFHLLPGDTPHRETVLEPGDLITHVTLPPPVAGSKQLYLKLRDRASYEFALASAAVVLTIAGGKVTRARIALGGVGTKPWRSPEAEAALVGQPADAANFRKAAEAALRDAKPQSENGFKIELAKRCLAHALQTGRDGLIPRRSERCRQHKTPRPTSPIGRDTPRVDGPLKVTGQAQYTSDFHFPGLLYAVPVEATIANGRIAELDTAAAEKMPGVRAIFHRGNIGQDLPLDPGAGFRRHRRRAPSAVRRRRDSLLRPVRRARRGRHVRDRQGRRRCRARDLRRREAERRHRSGGRRRAGRGAHHLRPDQAAAKRARRCRRAPSRARRSSSTRPTSRPPRPTIRIELHATTAIWDGDDADALRVVARRRQSPGRAGADVRPAEGERPRHHEVCRLRFRRQAVSVDALPARRRRGAAARASRSSSCSAAR